MNGRNVQAAGRPFAACFWELPPGQERFMAANAFFEHLGLVGGVLLVAWHDLKRSAASQEGRSFAHDQTHLGQKETA